jgi:hypothetical protein
MINRPGFTGLVKNLQPTKYDLNPPKSQTYITGRVSDIILDENHPLFKQFGEWDSIGIVFFDMIDKTNTGTSKIAKPLFPNTKTFPLINELIVCFQLPVPTFQTNSFKVEYYYLNTLNAWRHPHHNALPNLNNPLNPPSQNLDYQQVEGGMVRRVTDGSTEINLNSPINPSQNTFTEKINIHPLMPFMGDVIYEGRWGNSLRLGSTAKSKSSILNNWSEGGNNGDPITILRNGQPANSTDEGWIPITENINNDLASIYLTSNQKIPFNLSQPNLISYNGSAPDPKTFTSPQIILNSTRIVLNAKTDNVLISGQQSVSLSSIKSINIDAPKTIIQSSNIFLGDSNAVERGVMGDTLYNKLDVVLESLITLVRVLEAQQLWPGGLAAPDGGMMTTSSTVKSQLTNIKTTLTEILSKTVKTT